jgi:Protein of unknown function (DUF3222)
MSTESILAIAVLKTAIEHEVQCGRNAYNECRHCNGHVYWDEPVEDIEHEPNCPVLFAKSVLGVA